MDPNKTVADAGVRPDAELELILGEEDQEEDEDEEEVDSE